MNKIMGYSEEKCYYCENPGAYWDQVGATIISVCKEHSTNYYAG